MPQEPTKNQRPNIVRVLIAIVVLVALFLVAKFVFSALKWVVIAAGMAFVTWLYLRDETSQKK